jgi:hypothetical protein
MTKPSGAQTALALLLSGLGVGAAFLTWRRTAFLGIAHGEEGIDRWEGLTTAALFGASALCLLVSRRREASAWWHALGYFLLPLATIGLTCWYAWGFVPASVKMRLGVGTRLGAGFREFGSAFKWNAVGAGAYAAFGLALAMMLLGTIRPARPPEQPQQRR